MVTSYRSIDLCSGRLSWETQRLLTKFIVWAAAVGLIRQQPSLQLCGDSVVVYSFVKYRRDRDVIVLMPPVHWIAPSLLDSAARSTLIGHSNKTISKLYIRLRWLGCCAVLALFGSCTNTNSTIHSHSQYRWRLVRDWIMDDQYEWNEGLEPRNTMNTHRL